MRPTSAQQAPSASRELWLADGWDYSINWQPVNNPRDAEDFAKEFAQSLIDRDLDGFRSRVDLNLMAERAVAVCESESFRRNILNQIKKSSMGLFRQIAENPENYHFIRLRQNQWGIGPVFRLMLPNGGVAYHHWYLLRNNEGMVKAVDVYIFQAGESLGDNMKRIGLLTEPNKSQAFIARLDDRDREISQYQQVLRAFIEADGSQGGIQIMQLYDSLPESLKKSKFCMLHRVDAAARNEADRYLKTLTDYHESHPYDIAADLNALDFYSARKDYPRLIEAVTRIQKVIGPDAHLYLIRANAYLRQGDADMCRRMLKKAHQLQPDFEDVYWLRAACESVAGDFDATLRIFKYLVQKYDRLEFTHLEKSSQFQGFVGSPQYDEFQSYLKRAAELKTDFLSDDLD